MGTGIFGSTSQPSWKSTAPQRCPTHVEDPLRELIRKETRWLDGFAARELDPPPPKPTYDVTPPSSRPGSATPHFASTKLRRGPADGAILTVGCVPAGALDAAPASPRSKMAARAKATAAAAASRRDARRRRLRRESAGVDPDGNSAEATALWRARKTLEEPNVFETLRKKREAVDAARRAAATSAFRSSVPRPRGEHGFGLGLGLGFVIDASARARARSGETERVGRCSDARVEEDSSGIRPRRGVERASHGGVARGGHRPRRRGAPGEPGEAQAKPMVLSLDHLEDSSIEVLLHELRKVEKALEEGEETQELLETAAALERAAKAGGAIEASARR